RPPLPPTRRPPRPPPRPPRRGRARRSRSRRRPRIRRRRRAPAARSRPTQRRRRRSPSRFGDPPRRTRSTALIEAGPRRRRPPTRLRTAPDAPPRNLAARESDVVRLVVEGLISERAAPISLFLGCEPSWRERLWRVHPTTHRLSSWSLPRTRSLTRTRSTP